MNCRIVAATILALLAPAAGAELKFAAPDAFLIEHRYTIAAPAAKVWESLQHPERWWPVDHTWSGKRESLSLATEAGGCFCEKWAGGSAEHGRVVLAVPDKSLKLDAALGPFLDMAVSGILSIDLTEKEGVTSAVVTYRVSGDPAHKLDGLAPIVDQVLDTQFGAFAADAGK